MPKSNFALNLDTIMSEVHTRFLKVKGFKKSGNSFNRLTEDGLTQVVSFQAGQYLKSEYGSFGVHTGVFVPEVAELLDHKPKSFIHDYHCEWALRGTISNGRDENNNQLWFSLSDDPSGIIADLLPLFEKEWKNFFSHLESREQIISFLETKQKTTNDRIVLAMMYLHKGDSTRAISLLKEQYEQSAMKGHREYLDELAQRLHLSVHWQ